LHCMLICSIFCVISFVYVILYVSVFFRQYKWPSGPSVVDFK